MADQYSPWPKIRQTADEALMYAREGFEPVASRGEARKNREFVERHGLSQSQPMPRPVLSDAELAQKQAEISAKYEALEAARAAEAERAAPAPEWQAQGYKPYRHGRRGS